MAAHLFLFFFLAFHQFLLFYGSYTTYILHPALFGIQVYSWTAQLNVPINSLINLNEKKIEENCIRAWKEKMSTCLGDSQVQACFLTHASESTYFRKHPHFTSIIPVTTLDILPCSPDLLHGPRGAAGRNFILRKGPCAWWERPSLISEQLKKPGGLSGQNI